MDTIKAEKLQLEESIRAEQAEKEFFLRKLMEANKDFQGLSSGMFSFLLSSLFLLFIIIISLLFVCLYAL